MKIIWETLNRQHVNGDVGKLGKWSVFEVFYDGCVSKGSDYKYALVCRLPGIKARLGHFPDIPTAKVKAEAVAAHWIESARIS